MLNKAASSIISSPTSRIRKEIHQTIKDSSSQESNLRMEELKTKVHLKVIKVGLIEINLGRMMIFKYNIDIKVTLVNLNSKYYSKIIILPKFISMRPTLITLRWTLVLSSSILKLLSCEDESLIVWWISFLILDVGLDIIDDAALFNIKSNYLSSQSLDKDLLLSTSIFWVGALFGKQ